MDKAYDVKVTEHAENSMREIVNVITYELMAEQAAVHLLKTLKESMETLSFMPYRIALTDDEPWRSFGIRKMIVKNYFVYFWIDEENRRVQVTDVVYAKRNQKWVLEKMPLT